MERNAQELDQLSWPVPECSNDSDWNSRQVHQALRDIMQELSLPSYYNQSDDEPAKHPQQVLERCIQYCTQYLAKLERHHKVETVPANIDDIRIEDVRSGMVAIVASLMQMLNVFLSGEGGAIPPFHQMFETILEYHITLSTSLLKTAADGCTVIVQEKQPSTFASLHSLEQLVAQVTQREKIPELPRIEPPMEKMLTLVKRKKQQPAAKQVVQEMTPARREVLHREEKKRKESPNPQLSVPPKKSKRLDEMDELEEQLRQELRHAYEGQHELDDFIHAYQQEGSYLQTNVLLHEIHDPLEIDHVRVIEDGLDDRVQTPMSELSELSIAEKQEQMDDIDKLLLEMKQVNKKTKQIDRLLHQVL